MNRIIVSVATLAGASTIALSVLAAPAFAEVPGPISTSTSTSVPTPTETLSKNVTVSELIHSGVKAKFTGLTPGGQYQLVIATTASGGPVGDVLTADTSGDLTTKYVATDPGKKYRAMLVGDQYTLSLWDSAGTGAVASKTFAVKYGSELHWNSSHRSGGKLTVTATAKRWSPSTEKYVTWHNATVKFQEQKGTTWKTVKTVKTGAKGVAKATIKAGKHTWRAILSTSATVWTSKTGTHKR